MRPGFQERRRYKSHILIRGWGIVLFSFTGREEIPRLMSLISDIRPLHITAAHLLIGTADLPSVLRRKYENVRLTSRAPRTQEWLADIQEHILGGLDPLDNEINISGRQTIGEIVNTARRGK